MVRKQILLPETIDKYYADIAKRTGLSQAEIIRRVLDKHMLEHMPQPVSSASEPKGGFHGYTNESSPSETTA